MANYPAASQTADTIIRNGFVVVCYERVCDSITIAMWIKTLDMLPEQEKSFQIERMYGKMKKPQ